MKRTKYPINRIDQTERGSGKLVRVFRSFQALRKAMIKEGSSLPWIDAFIFHLKTDGAISTMSFRYELKK